MTTVGRNPLGLQDKLSKMTRPTKVKNQNMKTHTTISGCRAGRSEQHNVANTIKSAIIAAAWFIPAVICDTGVNGTIGYSGLSKKAYTNLHLQ